MHYKIILDTGFFVATTIVAIYAILDVRWRMRKLIELQRNAAWARVQNEMIWLFVDPTVPAYDLEISKALAEYSLFGRALNPQRTTADLKGAAEREALTMADSLVRKGSATWKPNVDLVEVQKNLREWESQKDSARTALAAKKRFLFW